MILKGLLDFVGAEVPNAHRLVVLWDRCREALAHRSPAGWSDFDAGQEELIRALDVVDPSSFTFRYPVDTQGTKVNRPKFINLDALNKHLDDLESAASGYIDYLDAQGLA